MKINPNVESSIQGYINDYFTNHKICSIQELLNSYNGPIRVTEAELRNTINNAVTSGNIQIINKKTPLDKSCVELSKPFTSENITSEISIVVSRPRFTELSLGSIELRNKQIDTISCFRKIIGSATKKIRICSPFIQEDILNKDAFPDIIQLFRDALERNVEIRLLSRELSKTHGKNVDWIIELAKSLKKEEKLIIVEYYISENKKIKSSTHAKLIIADDSLAYVGSAELRRNSLLANFEVGCMISNKDAVAGICEAFEFMFSKGTVW